MNEEANMHQQHLKPPAADPPEGTSPKKAIPKNNDTDKYIGTGASASQNILTETTASDLHAPGSPEIISSTKVSTEDSSETNTPVTDLPSSESSESKPRTNNLPLPNPANNTSAAESSGNGQDVKSQTEEPNIATTSDSDSENQTNTHTLDTDVIHSPGLATEASSTDNGYTFEREPYFPEPPDISNDYQPPYYQVSPFIEFMPEDEGQESLNSEDLANFGLNPYLPMPFVDDDPIPMSYSSNQDILIELEHDSGSSPSPIPFDVPQSTTDQAQEAISRKRSQQNRGPLASLALQEGSSSSDLSSQNSPARRPFFRTVKRTKTASKTQNQSSQTTEPNSTHPEVEAQEAQSFEPQPSTSRVEPQEAQSFEPQPSSSRTQVQPPNSPEPATSSARTQVQPPNSPEASTSSATTWSLPSRLLSPSISSIRRWNVRAHSPRPSTSAQIGEGGQLIHPTIYIMVPNERWNDSLPMSIRIRCEVTTEEYRNEVENLTRSMWSAIQRSDGVTALLALSSGADPFDCPIRPNWTTLHGAVVLGDLDFCLGVLEAGVDVNARDTPEGYTPLHLTAIWDRPEVALMLLQYNADLFLRDAKGMTPGELAKKRNHLSIVDLLAAVEYQESDNNDLTNSDDSGETSSLEPGEIRPCGSEGTDSLEPGEVRDGKIGEISSNESDEIYSDETNDINSDETEGANSDGTISDGTKGNETDGSNETL